MKKNIFVLSLVLASLSVTLIYILYLFSNDPHKERYSFTRILIPEAISELDNFNLGYNSYYIAGCTKHHIYFGNFTAPFKILVSNSNLKDTIHRRIQVKNRKNYKFRAIQVKVDSPNFYITDGTVPVIMKGTTTGWQAGRYMYDSTHFTLSLPVSSNSFAVRSINSETMEYLLGKINADTPHFKLMPNLLEKQIDGIFCTDGMLQYNREISRLVYVYYYRNQYIVMDTALNLKYRSNTIDPINHAQIKVAHITSKSSTKMSAPPLVVNKHCSIYKKWLFVHSNLLSKNESIELFNKASVIDVYDLEQGKYKFSFYLRDYNKKKLDDFQIYNDKLIAIYDRYAVTYALSIDNLDNQISKSN